MQQLKTKQKLSKSMLSLQRGTDTREIASTSDDCYSTSPTFSREACLKALLSWDTGNHILEPPANSITPPSSLPFSLATMDYSMISPSSSHSTVEKMNGSFGSIGLPSDYPVHRKNTSFSSVALEEELEDFEIFEDENAFEKQSLHSPLSSSSFGKRNSSSSFGGPPPAAFSSAATLTTSAKKMCHRRMNSDLFAFDSLTESPKLNQAHHRRHNYALGAKDFNDSVLTELFDDVSLTQCKG